MAFPVIKVDGVGKKFTINTKGQVSFRDFISNAGRRFLSSALPRKKAEEFWALRDLTFQVGEGETIGIIGRNGAGKSTLLKVLSRITEPTVGRIEIRGRVASLLEVGTGFHPELSGGENIYLNGTILGMRRAEIRAKFDEIVEFAGVSRFLNTPVKRYSSGMYVRLAFAVAAHLDPEILVVDEVLAVGDAEFQKKCLGKMHDVSVREGRTVLFVSHNLEALQNLCKRAILLNAGELVATGNATDVVLQYTNNFMTNVTEVRYDSLTAPGNSYARLLKAVVYHGENQQRGFRCDTPINFEFWIENLQEGFHQLDITYHLYDDKGICVFVGSTAFVGNPRSFGQGVIKAATTFPANILNYGVYSIKRLLFVMNRGHILTEWNDVLVFEILPNAANYTGSQGGKEGVLRLNNLEWKIAVENGENNS